MSYCTPACKHTLSPTLRQLLSQPDYAGADYEDLDHATVVCAVEGCSGRAYVTALCQGKPEADCGKYHNHSSECPGLGVCIHDYRNQHCERCGRHFFGGFHQAYKCSCHGGGVDNGEDSDSSGSDDSVPPLLTQPPLRNGKRVAAAAPALESEENVLKGRSLQQFLQARAVAQQLPPPMTTLFRGVCFTQADLPQLLIVQSELCARAARPSVGGRGGKKGRREEDGARHAAVAEIQRIIAHVHTM